MIFLWRGCMIFCVERFCDFITHSLTHSLRLHDFFCGGCRIFLWRGCVIFLCGEVV